MNHDLLHVYFGLWNASQSVQINLADEREDEIIWILEESGQYSAPPTTFSFRKNPIQFSKIDMESVGTAEMQNVPESI